MVTSVIPQASLDSKALAPLSTPLAIQSGKERDKLLRQNANSIANMKKLRNAGHRPGDAGLRPSQTEFVIGAL